MRLRASLLLLVSCSVGLAAEPPAIALRPIRSGTIASAPTHAVPVAGSAPMRIKDLADQVFVEPRARRAELVASRRALFADPVTEERFVETEHATIFESITSFTVDDPAALRASAPRLRKHNAAFQGRGGFTVARMTPEQKRRYDESKAEFLRKPAGHPLRKAAEKGDEALLDAIAAGQGDITITTALTVPKKRVKLEGKKASVPTMTAAGLDYAASAPRSFTKVPGATNLAVSGVAVKPTVVDSIVPATLDGTGSRTQTRDFLTGFTEYQSFDWSERWSFGKHDYFKIGAHAGYAFGIRAPVQVTGVIEPTRFSKRATRDLPAEYAVKLTAKPLDAGEGYYEDLGLSDGEAADGKEFVMEADAYATVDLEAGWGILSIHEKIPGNLGIDWGAHFVPPYDSCGDDCGFDLWVPASATRTQISLLGIVVGSAQIGVKLGGKGSIGIDYMSLQDGKGLDSTRAGKKARTHSLTFTAAGKSQKVETTLPARTAPGTSKFGYRLSDPRFDWTLTVTPGLKGGIDVNAKPFFSEEIDIGPFWFGALAMKLGTFSLGTHAGTPESYDLEPGEKTFSTPTAADLAAGNLPSVPLATKTAVTPAGSASGPTVQAKPAKVPAAPVTTAAPAKAAASPKVVQPATKKSGKQGG